MAGTYAQYGHAAEQLFLAGKTIKDIAEMLGISAKSIGEWSTKHKWAAKRKARSGSASEIIEFVLDVLQSKLRQLRDMPPEQVDAGMIDGIYKLMLMAEKLAKETRLLEKAVLVMDKYIDVVGKDLSQEDREVMFARVNTLLTYLETHE